MATFKKQVWINAPPEEVFETVADPDTASQIMPGVIDAEAEKEEGDGYRLEFTYKLAGIKVKRTIETVEYEPSERLVFELSGGITGTSKYAFSAQGTGTKVEFVAEYRLPNRVLDRLVRRFAVRYHDRQFDNMLDNLKDLIEMRQEQTEELPTA